MLRFLSFLLLWLSPMVLLAENGDPNDRASAGTDGPHVFYRGDKILVKYVLMRDTALIAKSRLFSSKQNISLTCQVQDTEDSFTFSLHDIPAEQPSVYPMPPKMLVLSDIEGDFAALRTMLIGADVIDKDLNWSFGDGHLVLVGDFFDRGLHVTECLWLLYKLETEAEAAGGKLHFILGNHEVLNLQGNSTYVRKKYLANADLINEPYERWYDRESELGRWLRSKNAVEKIGDFIFCHGGISPELIHTGLSLDAINQISRENLGKSPEYITDPYAQAVFDIKTGIFWYRDAARNQLSPEKMDEVMTYVGAKRMVVGHTMQNEVTTLYDGKLICIDLYHEENMREGFMETLWIGGDGQCAVLNNTGQLSSLTRIANPQKGH